MINKMILLTALFLSATLNVYAAESTVVSLKVNGMLSPTCPALLRSAVKKIDGVKSIKASLENKSAVIEFDQSKTSLEKIQDEIAFKVGFSTEEVKN